MSFSADGVWIPFATCRKRAGGYATWFILPKDPEFYLDSAVCCNSTLTMAADTPIAKTPSRLASARALWDRISVGRRKVATVAAAALALGVGYHVVFGANGLTVYEHKRQVMRSLNQQMQELQHENAQLKGHVDRLQSDPNAIEHQAREQLHYTRPGEVIYTLPTK